MSNSPKCAIDIVETANRAGNPIQSAVELLRPVHKESDKTIQTIACEQCGVELSISTELGNDRAQLELCAKPSNPDEACLGAKSTKEGDWVTNLNKRWFRTLLDAPEAEDTGSENPIDYIVSPSGLEAVLEDAAESHSRPMRPATKQINIGGILDLLLVRNDGKSWQEVIEERIT